VTGGAFGTGKSFASPAAMTWLWLASPSLARVYADVTNQEAITRAGKLQSARKFFMSLD
jgi:hypothetical protein